MTERRCILVTHTGYAFGFVNSTDIAKGVSMKRLVAVLVCLVMHLVMTPRASAQTTGTLSGIAIDQSGGLLPGVTILVVHTPTGTRYESVTDDQGRFAI